MADKADTLRDVLSGFNTMQAQLGLLPAQSGQQPMGVMPTAAPPPPPVAHPSVVSFQAVQQQQQMMQQAVQTAQMTRYQPPPSSPIGPGGGGGGGFTWGSSYAAMGASQFSPQMANAMGGGGIGMPNPIYSTAPQYGMYRPQGAMGGMMSPMAMRPPAIFNPLAAQLPAPHFMTPAMQQYQIMQAHQATSLGLVGGLAEGGLGIGGSLLGGAIGGAFGGPIGGMVGSWLGGKVGGAVSNATIGPAFDDVRRGRQLQNMTAPWMVAGAGLNPFTGQGMNREASTDTARQLRTMVRDHDFQRTGFNTQDVMRITQLASDQGLLQTAQNPEDIARKVKDISKSVKALIQITGDPDVRNAISHLGEMRQLGFNGLGGQTGAVANRAAFARMAGVSQTAMHEQFGMPGAMMAQNLGLAGATGYTAGMVGAGNANVAVSAGALNDLQLARAGGKQGLSQINAAAGLAALNQDVFLGAAMKVGPSGKMSIDANEYQRLMKTTSVDQASRLMGQNMSRLSPQQLADFSSGALRGEMKDKLATELGPNGLSDLAARQAMVMMRTDKNLSFESALRGMGMSDSDSRAYALEYTNKGFYQGRTQQLEVQRRDAGDRERARRDQFRTPGLLTNAGRGVRGVLYSANDAMASPFAALMERSQRADEDIAAAARGEHVERFGASELANTAQARQAMRAAGAASSDREFAGAGVDPASQGTGSRWFNRVARAAGWGALSDANRAARLANEAEGGGWFGMHTNLGDAQTAMVKLQKINMAATGIRSAQTMTVDRAVDTMMKLQGQGTAFTQAKKKQFNARAVVADAVKRLSSDPRVTKAGKGGVTDAGAINVDVLHDAISAAMQSGGLSEDEARKLLSSSGNDWVAMLTREAQMTGDRGLTESLNKSLDISSDTGAMRGRGQREEVVETANKALEGLGLDRGMFDHKAFEQTKKLIADTDPKVLAFAAAKRAMSSGSDSEKQAAQDVLASLRSQFGTDAKGERAFQELATRGSALEGGMTKDVGTNLMHLVKKGESGFYDAQKAVGKGINAQVASTALQKLQKTTNRKDLEDMGLEGAAMNLTAEEVTAVKGDNAKLGATIERFRKGKASIDDLYAAAADQGAAATTEVRGGERGGGEAIDKQENDLLELQQALADKESQTADKFDKAVDKLDDVLSRAMENGRLDAADPHGLTRGGR